MVFVTDRTDADVIAKNSKGKYTAEDLNRVESNVKELADMAVDIDVHFYPAVKTNWSRTDQWMNGLQSKRYAGNVRSLAYACGIGTNIPENMDNLNINDANNIEKALESVYNKIVNITSTFQYSGELFAE